MIYDKDVMFADGDPVVHVGEVDLNSILPDGVDKSYGPGNPILVHVTGKDLVVDGSNNYAVVVESSLVPGGPHGPEMRVQVGPNSMNQKGVTFGLSSVVSRVVAIHLEGFTDGEWTAGVVLGNYT